MQERHGYAKSEAMPTDDPQPQTDHPETAESPPEQRGPLTPEAQRAIAEAAARRAEAPATVATDKEVGGRGGLDPARYGDWEINGLTSDF